MLSKRWTMVACLSAFLASSFCDATKAQELTDNGDFEINDGELPPLGWDGFPSPPNSFTIESDDPFEGFGYGKIVTTTLATGSVAKQARIGIGVVEPFQDIAINFWARGSGVAGGVQIVEFFSELAGEGTSKSEILGGGPLFLTSDTEWVEYNFVATTGPDVGGGVTLQFVAATGGAAGSEAVFDFDNVSVQIFDGLAGDYNDDGIVNIADYTVWRDNLGGDSAALNGNGTGADTVTAGDYGLWKDKFGAEAPLGSLETASGQIPEPSSVLMFVLCGLAIGAGRLRLTFC